METSALHRTTTTASATPHTGHFAQLTLQRPISHFPSCFPSETETEYSPHTDHSEELACSRSSYSSLKNVEGDKGVDPEDSKAKNEGGQILVLINAIGLLL